MSYDELKETNETLEAEIIEAIDELADLPQLSKDDF